MRAEIYKIFEAYNIALKDLKEVDLSEFSGKRTLKCVVGVDIKGFYTIVFIRSAKSRFLKKEFEDIVQIYSKIQTKLGINIKKPIIFYTSEICSKTKNLMQELGWKHDTV
ncbi:hypothetical protein [Campylobacter sp.]|uniref:hypothetical protein n=1 Tax=Campylobacter sp. TaxID=205 RepID=UPI0026FF2366|nr:hypothetical protein [Campylobacter sp.]